MQKKRKKVVIASLSVLIALYLLLIAYAYLPSGTTLDPRSLAGPDSSFVEVEGKRIHYIRQGNGSPVILIHGFGGSTYTWRKLIPCLADTHTVYAIDLPGFGLSDKPPRSDYSLAAQAHTVIAWMDRLNLSRATLVGHSMGGVVAAYAALERPSVIENLILVEPGFYHGKAPSFLRYLFFPLQRIFAKSFYTRTGRIRSLAMSFYNKDLVTDEVLEGYLKAAKTPGAVDALAHMMSSAAGESYEGLSARISVPTLLVWSSTNKNNPLSDGERLAREIRHSRLIVVQDSGHYIQEEQPLVLADSIKKFLD